MGPARGLVSNLGTLTNQAIKAHPASVTQARNWREEEGSPGTPCFVDRLRTMQQPGNTTKNTVMCRTSFPPPMVVYCWKHGPKQINSPKLGLGGDTPPRVELGQEGGDP